MKSMVGHGDVGLRWRSIHPANAKMSQPMRAVDATAVVEGGNGPKVAAK
jgi:hypothetical protein